MRHSCGKGSDGRIFWSDDEYEKVLKSYHSMVVKGTVPRKSEEAMREAQKVLPPSRHRNFKYSAQAAPLLRKYRQMIKDKIITNVPQSARAIVEGRPKKKAEAAPAPSPIPTPPTESQLQPGDVLINGLAVKKEIFDAVSAHVKATLPPPKPVRQSLDEVFSALIDERLNMALGDKLDRFYANVNASLAEGNANIQTMFQRQGEMLKDVLLENHAAVMRWMDPQWEPPKPSQTEQQPREEPQEQKSTPVIKVDEATAVAPSPKRLKVLVVGAEGQFASGVQHRFPTIDIEHVDKRSMKPSGANGADLVVGTKWAGHVQVNNYRNAYGERFVMSKGGLDAISEIIESRLHVQREARYLN